MSISRAVVWTDHQSAKIMLVVDEHAMARTIRAHNYQTVQHGSNVRTQHEFYAELCDELDRVAEVLVTGSHTAIADFRHYVDKHRPPTAARIVAYDVVDQPTENQLVAQARKYFGERDRLGAVASPG